jgi:hypothetical protein
MDPNGLGFGPKVGDTRVFQGIEEQVETYFDKKDWTKSLGLAIIWGLARPRGPAVSFQSGV